MDRTSPDNVTNIYVRAKNATFQSAQFAQLDCAAQTSGMSTNCGRRFAAELTCGFAIKDAIDPSHQQKGRIRGLFLLPAPILKRSEPTDLRATIEIEHFRHIGHGFWIWGDAIAGANHRIFTRVVTGQRQLDISVEQL